MAVNQNLEAIKKEFENDEKILESAFRLERFFKKYKYILIGIVVVLIAWGAYINIYEYLEEKKSQEISDIYDELLASPQNEVLRKSLKQKSPELYDLFLYSELFKENNINGFEELLHSPNQIVKDFATYQIASLKEDKQGLGDIHSAFKDFAKLQEAYLYIKANDIKKARETLNLIASDSALAPIVEQLKHYGIKDFPLQNEMKIQELTNEQSK